MGNRNSKTTKSFNVKSSNVKSYLDEQLANAMIIADDLWQQSESEREKSLQLLQKIYQNIKNNPTEPKYRKLNMSAISKQSIAPQVKQILLCSGFTRNNNAVHLDLNDNNFHLCIAVGDMIEQRIYNSVGDILIEQRINDETVQDFSPTNVPTTSNTTSPLIDKRDSEFYGDHPIDEIYSYTFITKPFGMEWKTTKSDKKNLYVSAVQKGSQAALGNVLVGSRLISLNGEMIEDLGAKQIYGKLALSDMPLTITFLKPFKKEQDKEDDNYKPKSNKPSPVIKPVQLKKEPVKSSVYRNQSKLIADQYYRNFATEKTAKSNNNQLLSENNQLMYDKNQFKKVSELETIKTKESYQVTENKLNPYPYTTTQFFDNLLPIFMLYLDDITLCNLLKVESFCMAFNLQKLITPKQFMERFTNETNTRLQKLQELYKKKIRKYGSMKFATWNITNYNLKHKHKDQSKTRRRIACVSLLMQHYVCLEDDQMLGVNKDVEIDGKYWVHWREYAKKKMKSNKKKKFDAFSYGDHWSEKELLMNGGSAQWDSYDGKLYSEKNLNKIFMSGKVFGQYGELLYKQVDRLLLGSMMELMVKEWIVLDGGISQDNLFDHHSERFTFIFGWISPQCVVMIGGAYKVNSFDYGDSDSNSAGWIIGPPPLDFVAD